MLISSWFLSVAFLLVPCALCSDVQDDKVNEKTPKQLQMETDRDAYKYNHPPLPEPTEVMRSRKEKSVNLDEQSTSKPIRSRSRGTRGGTSPRPTTETELKIPVEVIYESTTTRPSSTTTPSVERTTRILKRKRLQSTNTAKNIDIRDTTISNTPSTEKVEVTQTTIKDNASAVTEFPKRSRDSYFKKRTGPPPPKVKILEEKNFVYSHSGNFHYSFLGGDGTKVSSQGELRSYDNNKTGEAVSGNVFYTDKDGNDFSLSYTADENGYRPVGAHLPTPPPLPPAIAAALKYIAEKSTTTAPETKHDN